jgi:succinate dehydrogenase / fumarate reductase membrane anchor subunit
MQNASAKQRAKGAAGGLWLLQVISGALLIVVLGLHMFAQHFVVEGGLRNFQDVLAYVSNPLILVIELVFLIVVTFHAMLGLRAILLDLGPSAKAERTINIVLAVIGVGAAGYGIYLALALQALAFQALAR